MKDQSRFIDNTKQAIRVISALRPHQFIPKLAAWALEPSFKQHVASLLTTGHTCGTTFCLAGWLTQDPHFQKQGLWLTGADCEGHRAPVIVREGVVYAGFKTAAHLFGDDSEYLFHMSDTGSKGKEKQVVLDRLHAHLTTLLEHQAVHEKDVVEKAFKAFVKSLTTAPQVKEEVI